MAAVNFIGQAAKLYEEARVFSTGVTNGVQKPAQVAKADAAEFENFVGNAVSSTVGTLRQAESVSAAGVAGKASAQQVAEGVMAAEVTLQAAVAIRDKMVSAYQEIMRMPV